jgi:hypothetical protein
MKKRLLTIFLAMVFTCVNAQNSQVSYFMNIPQNHFLNPSFRPSSRIYIGLPAMTGMNLNISNNFFNFRDVFMKGAEISGKSFSFLNPDFDVARFLSRVKEKNFFETNLNIQLLGVGFAIGPKNYFFIDLNERISENLVLPGDLLRLAFLGTQNYAGRTLDLSGTRVDARVFHEAGFGFSREITPNLRFGVKGKVLFGVASLSGRADKMDLTVNNDLSATLNTDAILHNNGAIKFAFNDDGSIESGEALIGTFKNGDDIVKYLTNTSNMGFGIDLGAEYVISKRITVSAAVTDLGYINWKADDRTNDVRAKNVIQFHGFDFTKIYDGSITIDSLVKTMTDTLKTAITGTTPGSFRSQLPATFTVGGMFSLNDMLSVGAVSSSRMVDRQVREAFTISGNAHLWSIFDFSLTYTLANRSYNNLGAGVAVRGGFAQFYFMVDRIPLKWESAGDSQNKITLPANWNTVNAWFGINLVFGNRRKDQI